MRAELASCRHEKRRPLGDRRAVLGEDGRQRGEWNGQHHDVDAAELDVRNRARDHRVGKRGHRVAVDLERARLRDQLRLPGGPAAELHLEPRSRQDQRQAALVAISQETDTWVKKTMGPVYGSYIKAAGQWIQSLSEPNLQVGAAEQP